MKRYANLCLLVAIFVLGACEVVANEVATSASCSFFTFLPFTSSDAVSSNNTSAILASKRAYSFAAAALMAVDHFNSRDTSVVPDLADMTSCQFRLHDPIFLDSKGDATSSVQILFDYAAEFVHSSASAPCAILGPHNTAATRNLQAAAIAMRVPLVNYYNDDERYARELATDPSIVGLTLPVGQKAQATVDFLQQFGVVATWSNKGPFDVSIVDEMALLSRGSDLELIQFNAGMETQDWASQGLLNSGITDVLVDLKTMEELQSFAAIADDLGMLAAEYSYILPSDLASAEALATLDVTKTSNATEPPIRRLLSGALTFDRVDPSQESSVPSLFRGAWDRQTSVAVERLNSLVPSSALFKGTDAYFQEEDPVSFASLIYDAVMTIGIGGCISNPTTPTPTSSPTPAVVRSNEQPLSTFLGVYPLLPSNRRVLQASRNDSETSSSLTDGIAKTSFVGASGSIDTGNEQSNGTALGLYNIRPQVSADDNSTVSFEPVLVQKYSPSTAWVEIDGERIVFRDGSTDRQGKGRKIYDHHYLSRRVRTLGMAALGLAWLASVGSGIAVWVLKKDGAVQRAQPFFLMVLCAGSFVMSTSIFTLSWDEGTGFTTSQLSIMCMATPWLFFLGEIMIFCALFTKLWRVDKVLQFRRRKVTIGNVVAPTLVLLVLTVSILLLWTITDPWKWDRQLIRQIPAEDYGKCSSKDIWRYFGPLAGLALCAQVLSFYFAWKTADIPSDFQDTSAVMYASFTQFQAWAVGIPILTVIGTSSADGTYLGRMLLIWSFAISSVVIVVWPKVYKAIQIRRHPDQRNSKGRVSVTGLHQHKPESSLATTRNSNNNNHLVSQFTHSAGSNHPNSPVKGTHRQRQENPEGLDTVEVWQDCEGLRPVRLSVLSMAEI